MRQAVTTDDPATFEIEELTSTAPGPGQVLLRIRGCGICGSDLHAYRDRTRWTAGRVLGHEIAGEVAELGEGVTGLTVGQRVALQPRLFCGQCAECRGGRTELCRQSDGLHGFQQPGGFRETLTVPQENLFPVADDLDFAVAALAEPLAVAVHGHRVAAQLDSARPTKGERVVVLGAGPIGLMSVFYATQAGAEVTVTARYDHQAEAARMLGAAHVFDSDDDGPLKLEAWSKEHPVDLVMETVGGSAETPTLAGRVARMGGRVLILGGFADGIGMPANLIMGRQLRIAGTIFYGYIGMQHDYEIATMLLEEHREMLGRLITHRVSLEEVAAGIAYAGDKSSGALKVTVEP
jgi:threonine dehydrogenase-like Zn-dependent dehydrogenase